MQNGVIIPCNFDTNRYSKKPSEKEVPKIKTNIGNGFVELPIKEVVNRLTSGYSMGFYGLAGAKSTDFQCARQFGIDFDNENLLESGIAKRIHNTKKENKDNQIAYEPKDFMPVISYADVKDTLRNNGIEIAYTIKTTSFGKVCPVRNIPLEKFKVFVVTDEIITDAEEAKKCILALMYLFPQADQSGKDLARFTFGTSNGLIGLVNEVTNKKQILLDIFDKIPSEEKPVERKPYVPKTDRTGIKLDDLYANFDLLAYMKENYPSSRVTKQGRYYYFTPHPFTGSEKSKGFCVYDDNTFCDYSNGNLKGNIFTLLTHYEDYTEVQARNKVKELCGIDIEAEKEEWKKQQKPQQIEIDLSALQFPFDDEVYKYIVSIDSEIEREKVRTKVEEIARKSSIKDEKTFNKLYKLFEKEKPRAKDEENKVTNYNIQNELYCGTWIADINGIRAFHNNTEIKASNTAIYPIKLMKNMQSKEQKAKIAFYDKGKWQELFVEKDMLLVSSKVVNLAKYGVLVTSDWAKHLTNYFAEVFQKNHFQEFLSTSKMGWDNQYNSFLPITPSDLELDTHISFSSMVNSLEPKGDKEEYLKFIKRILTGSRKEPKIALITSLASVLVQPLGCLSFILHIYGQAGIGKTLITKMCAGVWGNPIENGFLIDPKNTPTSFEIILNLLNNLPFIADDINKINFTPWFTQRDLNYLLCSGSGKQRSNVKLTIEEVKTWKNLSILNGEKALTTDDSHGGELLRTVELQLEPKALFKDGNKVAEFLHNNYGFLGKMFIEYIIEYNQIEQAKSMKQEFTQKVIDTYGSSKEGKQIESLGLLYATQDIICAMLGIERTLHFEDFASLIKDIDDVLDTKRACKVISDIIEQNFSSFVDDTIKYAYNETPHIPNVKWGWKISDDEVLIIPNQFNELCKKANIDRRLFLEWCAKEKVIDVGSGKDFSKVVKIKCENKTYRGYKFKLEQFE